MATYVDWARDEVPDYEVSGAVLDLGVGRVGRIDLARVEASATGENYGTKYLFSDGHRWLALDCTSTTSPAADHWLSIAETIEFLPAEE